MHQTKPLSFFLCLCIATTNLANAFEAGFRLEQFEDSQRARSILIDWWYPVANQTAQKYNYGLGSGKVVEDGSIAVGEFPLVVLSHGAMGAARNYSWIAEALARNGYVVAGISHYGESYVYGPATIDPSAVVRFWERSVDVSAALTYIEKHSTMAGSIDPGHIGFLGHSSGGATALSLAGVVFNLQHLASYCRSSRAAADRGCDYGDSDTDTPTQRPEDEVASKQSYLDNRITTFVALDPALGPGLTDFTGVDPANKMLIVGSVQNDFLPFQHHAELLGRGYPMSDLYKLDDGEGHFVYLNQCSQDIKANGVPLCEDREGVSRAIVHEKLTQLVLRHFNGSLQPTR